MKRSIDQKVFCSLDIETSGFDPLTSEILEVGFAFFVLTEQGSQITEEWSQIFKPSKKVPPQILGLTGLTQAELDEAPLFSEHRDFIQNKLKNASIVGHNIMFDINFLEGFGIKFEGEIVDTLDLVQFLLPTHHSYNLENLMHTFNISHKEAHRALADSRAAIQLLEKLLQVYNGLSKRLRDNMKKLISSYNFGWKNMLNISLPPINFVHEKPSIAHQKRDFEFKSDTIYNFGLDQNWSSILSLTKNKKVLWVLPKTRDALDLQEAGLADEAVFLPELLFNQQKFEEVLKYKNLSEDEIKFLLKVLVWQETNWQTKTFLDLNLSFFGGQFKNLVSGGQIQQDPKAKIAACDLPTFLFLSEQGLYKDYHVIICGLNDFEAAVTYNIGSKVSWGKATYLLKSYYNPELNLGNQEYKEAVNEGLAASDLFFGLVSAFYQTEPPSFLDLKVSSEFKLSEKYNKILGASANYLQKLQKVNLTLNSEELGKFATNLENFFKEEENRVKWIELSANRCAFISMPLDITGLVGAALKPFSKISFADFLDPVNLPKFFIRRIGLKNFVVENIKSQPNLTQGDLFSSLKEIFLPKRAIKYRCLEKTAQESDILGLISGQKELPAAVLFGSPLQVREFYEQNFKNLKTYATVLAQTSSGGSNKILRNFNINPHTVMLVTDKFVLKHLSAQNVVQSVQHLPVKTLIFCRLPFDQFTHPYLEAVSKSFPNAFEDFSLPKALYNFHSLIRFFYTPTLEDIYIIDSKLSKPYAQVFKNYWQNIPLAQAK